MHQRWRGVGLALTGTTMLAVSACTSSDTSSTAAVSAEKAAPGVYGTPVDPSLPNPTAVATDPPVTVAPTTAGSVFVTRSGWNSSAGAVEVAGYVPGVVESDGVCTLTVSKGGDAVPVSGPGTPNASSTSCGGLSVPRAQLSTGTWTAVLSYRSPRSTAASTPVSVEVP